MAQTGYTPILLYSSSTASQAPTAGNLTNSTLGSELAINITDGKLFYKDNTNAVQVIAWKVTPTTAGGTGLTSYTAGDLIYYASGTTFTKLAIGTTGQWLGSSGSAPQWNAPAALTKTDDTNVTLTLGGSASTALLNAASLTLGWTGTLAVSRGGTGTGTAFTTGSIIFAGASGVYSQNNANLFWDNTNTRLGIGTTSPGVTVRIQGANETLFSPNVFNTRIAGTSSATSGNAGGGISFMGYTTGTTTFNDLAFVSGIKANNTDGNYDGALVFGVRNNGSGAGNFERARIHASGGFSIGNTTDPGASNLLVAGWVYTTKGTVSCTSGVATTMFTIPSNVAFFAKLDVWFGGSSNVGTVTVAQSGASGATPALLGSSVSGLTFSLSGQNVQVTQTSGVTLTANWSYIRNVGS